MKTRKAIITSFFDYLIDNNSNYAILHHIDRTFKTNHDIDFIVDCEKDKMLELVINYCKKENLYLIDFYTIDQDICRFGVVFYLDNKLESLELDCACKSSGKDFLKLNSTNLLQNRMLVEVEDSLLFKVACFDEIEHYIQKKAYKNIRFKNVEITEYYSFLKKLNPKLTIEDINSRFQFWEDYYQSLHYKLKFWRNKFLLLKTRFKERPAMSLCFMGPDGSGKSTIIEHLMNGPLFINKSYFHLKPFPPKKNVQVTTIDPHKFPTYSRVLSYLKLFLFLFQYNLGWLKYIFPLKLKSSLIIFDRYFDDLLVDNKRYRYGGSKRIAKLVLSFIPKPDIYFILTAEAQIIHPRKKEVAFEELVRQIDGYRNLAEGERYVNIDVNRAPKEIVEEITNILMKKVNERY